MDKQVSIQEEKISLTPEERGDILAYFRRVKTVVDNMVPDSGSRIASFLNSDLMLNKLRGKFSPVPVSFYFDVKDQRKGLYENPPNQKIWLNIAAFSAREFDQSKGIFLPVRERVLKLNYSKMVAVFAHEWVHYKQETMKRNATFTKRVKSDKLGTKDNYKGLVSKKSYMLQPFEQQAWAVEYLELLKQNLPTLKPMDILVRLKRLGVVDHEDLKDLKKTDYKAWKAIMKNIIVTALQDLKQQEPKKL